MPYPLHRLRPSYMDYKPCATLANIPFEYFRVTRCPACVWRLPDRSPFRCSHLLKVLLVASSCCRCQHLFNNVSTPLRVLCMLVGVAFRGIGNLCLQGESALAPSFALLPSPSVAFTQAYIYNIYANVPVLAVSFPHALRVTLRPFSHWSQVVSTMSIIPPKGNGNASPLESRCKGITIIWNIRQTKKKK